MIGKFERHCPKCGAGICRYNAGSFCWPCQPPEGFVWHWSDLTHEWVQIPVLKLEPEFEPQPGDIVLSEGFTPAPRKRERETELAALIESQGDELQRGDWVDSEKGHWADKSIDAPLTADGFTILDTLGDEDEALAAFVGEAA